MINSRNNTLLIFGGWLIFLFVLGFYMTGCNDADAVEIASTQNCDVVLQNRFEKVTECAFGGNICYLYYAQTGSSIVCDYGGRPAEEDK